jgi:hypothetical protein
MDPGTDFQEGDIVELLWEVEVRTDEGNHYIYPAGTRLIFLKSGSLPDTSDLVDDGGNIFPGLPNSHFYKV